MLAVMIQTVSRYKLEIFRDILPFDPSVCIGCEHSEQDWTERHPRHEVPRLVGSLI